MFEVRTSAGASAAPLGRGEGMVYMGSVAAARGAVVSSMDDCHCERCRVLDVLDPARRASALLTDGRTLICASFSSFQRP